MNQFDTDLMRSGFLKSGYTVVDFEEEADVYIINTCTVTVGGDRSSRQAIYRARRRNPRALVVATGCYAQVKPEELASLREVDLVVGNTHKEEILKLVEEQLEKREKKGEVFRQKELKGFGTVLYFEGSRPFLKVQEGCNRFCTFCVIPFARGKVRSAEPEVIVRQAEYLAERGFQEIVLTGTQLSQYGWDRGRTLYDLLRDLLKVKGVELIRLSSLHIKEMDKKLLDLITSEGKIAPHFHLSLQSGSDRILRLMERGYLSGEFLRIASLILSRRPESALGTDVIVGFPTETEEDFRQTLNLIEEVPFAYLHIFPYSDRPFTKASRMKGKVQDRVKKERVKLLEELDRRKREEFLKRNRGRRLRAVVLGGDRLLTENYIDLRRKVSAEPGRVVEVVL